LRRVRDMISAANHVCDAHVDVVHHNAKLVHGLPEFLAALARTQQDEILDFIVRKLALAEDRVRKFGRSTEWDFEANRRLCSWRRRFPIAAGAARDAPRPATLWLLILARLIWLGVIASGVFVRRTVAEKRAAARHALLGRRAIEFASLRLVERPFVPVHAQPFQALDDPLHQLGLVALGVGILNTQNHHPAMTPCEEPVE